MAVDLTRHEVLIYNQSVLPAYYHSMCGGKTENAEEIFGITLPPLRGKRCIYCQKAPHRYWKTMFSYKQIEEKPGIQKAEVKKKLPDQLIIKLQKKETKEDKIGQILKQLRLRLFQPEKATFISERAVEILFKDNLQVIFSLKKEIEVQLDSLQLISSRAKIEGKKIKRLDLRFDKPVVVYD